MPRANRYLLSNRIYHVTHHCHDRRFLLKFARDRNDYRLMALQMSQRYDVTFLQYCLTCNHVHLLLEAKDKEPISYLMQDLAGTFGQNYNRRKKHSGGYWEGRYHATMIDSGPYLWACLLYIDMNMVRAGVVSHPEQWPWTGWQEIMGIRKRYCLINQDRLLAWAGHEDMAQFRIHYAQEITDRIEKQVLYRESQWTDAVAVGTESFIESVAQKIPGRSRWKIEELAVGRHSGNVLREPTPAYMRFSGPKIKPKA
ncbi:transposase [Planctomycetota bacterium]